jgi:fatty acid desaturase
MQRWFQRNCQGFMFWPLTTFLAFSMRASTAVYLYKYARVRGIDRKWSLDVFCLVMYVVVWIVLPMYFFGWMGLAFYVGIWFFIGGMLAAIFAPAHMSMPILTDHSDKWRLQLETSRNLRMPGWLSFFFVGLDYQIEHHLFPRIPHQNLPVAAPIVRRWTARNSAPYFVVNYGKGVSDVTRFMDNAWDIDTINEDEIEKWQLKRSEWDASGKWTTDLKRRSLWQRFKSNFFINLPGPSALPNQ